MTGEALHERIKARRIRLRLTQDDLAGLVGVRREQVSAWENGHARPSGDNLISVARALQVTPNWLIADSGEADSSPESPSFAFPKDAPPHGLQIIGHIEAELMRQREQGDEGSVQEAFEIVERRVQRLRGEGRIDDAGYAYWRALRRGAMLAGGYEPDEPEPEDPALDDRAQQSIA